MTSTVIDHAPQTQTTDGAGHFTHIVRVPDDSKLDAVTYVLEARIYGVAVSALCGFRWVPQRDPGKYPRCPKCQEIYDGFEASKDGDPSA